MIQVLDYKNTWWDLIPVGCRGHLHKGEHITTLYLYRVTSDEMEDYGDLSNYHEIPVPVFTEWWV